MATKKTVTEAEEILQEEVKEEPAAKDPWEVEEQMIVPRKPKGEDQSYYVCVNDRRFYIPANGKMQSLPKPVANVLRDSIEAEYEADDFMDKMPNRSGEQPQEHAI